MPQTKHLYIAVFVSVAIAIALSLFLFVQKADAPHEGLGATVIFANPKDTYSVAPRAETIDTSTRAEFIARVRSELLRDPVTEEKKEKKIEVIETTPLQVEQTVVPETESVPTIDPIQTDDIIVPPVTDVVDTVPLPSTEQVSAP